MTRKIGILTGGGDAPGLNAVIRAVVKYGAGKLGWEIIGIEESFNGLMFDDKTSWSLTPKSCQGLLGRGGTILGTTNRGDPFKTDKNGFLPVSKLKQNFDELELEGLIVIGGDGTQTIGFKLMNDYGIPVIGVPKTIDNDLANTDFTFGFWSAVDVATDALDRLHTTAESHDRVMFLEVMGRTAGWIALYAGIAGGADCIVLPEIPYRPEVFINKILERRKKGRHFTIVIVAEGAKPAWKHDPTEPVSTSKRFISGKASHMLAEMIQERIDVECRVTVLGHIQRGGSPVPFDRVLATRFGHKAVELVKQNKWGHLAVLQNGEMKDIHLREVAGAPREIDPNDQLIATARNVGIVFGDEEQLN
jgi:ATP-dependent phosphofructokinase / diphosphate-dependent phosphofructokinase